jgi:pyrimidine operon attenuation protein/uracil phosphoribosyltransferase
MLQVLGHANLPHELHENLIKRIMRYGTKKTNLVLVPVHSSQGTDVTEDVLESVRKLEGVDVTETELDMRVDNELSQPQNLTTEMESVSETRLLAFLRGEGSASG